MQRQVQERVGRELMIHVEAEAGLVRGGRDAGGGQRAHRRAGGGEAGARAVEAVDPSRARIPAAINLLLDSSRFSVEWLKARPITS